MERSQAKQKDESLPHEDTVLTHRDTAWSHLNAEYKKHELVETVKWCLPRANGEIGAWGNYGHVSQWI